MARKFSIWIRRIKGTLPPDTINDGNGTATHVCALGVSGQGNRVTIPPNQFFAGASNTEYDIIRDTINPNWEFNIPNADTEHIFYLWLFESDNKSITNNWQEMEQAFENIMERNIEKLQSLGYPEQQMHFLAFTESFLQLHQTMQTIKNRIQWADPNNDDVHLAGIFHFSHVDGNTLLPSGLINEPVRNQKFEGFTDSTCYIDPRHPFDLTFRYEYSPASGLLVLED